MESQNKEFCFCTLGLGKRYRDMVLNLGKELEKYSPGTTLILFTDKPKEFSHSPNIIPFKHRQQGILHCYNDKRFTLAKALSLFPVAIYIDADTRVENAIPSNIAWQPGMTGKQDNLMEHMTKYRPQNLPAVKKLEEKLGISKEAMENAQWIYDSLFVIARDGGKEQEFLEAWGKVASYMELNRMYSGQGNLMGLAAAKIGWEIHEEGWQEINQVTNHWDASLSRPQITPWKNFQKKLGYHYRLNRERLKSLKDFDFYYR